jgi:hypothetical protein
MLVRKRGVATLRGDARRRRVSFAFAPIRDSAQPRFGDNDALTIGAAGRRTTTLLEAPDNWLTASGQPI